VNHNKKILMIFIEPTPYIMDLLTYGFSDYKKQLDIIFLSENLTQQWDLASSVIQFSILQSKRKLISLLVSIFFQRKYKLIHIAGWSRFFTLFLILISRFFFLPITVETDTPLNFSIPLWKKTIKKLLYPALFRFPAFFLPGGKRQAGYLHYYGVSNQKIIHAQMTVDVERIKKYIDHLDLLDREKLRTQHGAQKEAVIFLYVGRLLDWKGIRELMAATQLLDDKVATLWIVGDGELADEVKLAALQCKQINYLGRVSGEFLWRIYNAADVFVLPSHWEPWGLVVNEAMAAGKPLIVSRTVGCIDDLVFEHREGLIVEPKEVASLYNAMDFMLKNPEKRIMMASNASNLIAGWTLKNEANNMMTAWKKVLHD